MFSNLTSILTITAMLLHSILGCCSHHAHACEHGQFVGKCPVEHGEHDSRSSEAAHADEEHADHHACADAGRDADEPLEAECESGLGSCGMPERSQDPCQQTCDGTDCSFTQSSEVKTPAPDDGRLIFPATTLLVSGVLLAGCLSANPVDSSPPDGVAYCCCRSMTQIWRL